VLRGAKQMSVQKGDFVNINAGEFKGEIGKVVATKASKVNVIVYNRIVTLNKDHVTLV
jgi:ribosomal protein L24